jgi:hypothetical protein
VIPPDQHDQFDELGVVIAAGKHRPRGVTDAAVGMQFVGGPEQRRFEGVPVSTGAVRRMKVSRRRESSERRQMAGWDAASTMVSTRTCHAMPCMPDQTADFTFPRALTQNPTKSFMWSAGRARRNRFPAGDPVLPATSSSPVIAVQRMNGGQ